MNDPHGIRSGWTIAASRPGTGTLRALCIDDTMPRINATITELGEVGILIQVDREAEIGPVVRAVTTASTVLVAEIFPFFEDGKQARGFHLWCTQRELKEAFAGFCDTFITRIKGECDLLKAFSTCYTDFQRLIAAPTTAALTEKTVGLLGELVVLTELLAADPTAVDYWAFPVPERHDYRHNKVALEIKTTLRSRDSRPVVTISSLDQLEAPKDGDLFLHWLRLELDASGSLSVEMLVNRIKSMLTPERRLKFSARVSGVNLSDGHAKTSFSMQEMRCYHVQEAFPRLIPSRLLSREPDPGIMKITYQLDLSAAAAYQMPAADVYHALLEGEYLQ